MKNKMWDTNNTKTYLKKIDRPLYKLCSTYVGIMILIAICCGLYYCWKTPHILEKIGVSRITVFLYIIPVAISLIMIILITFGQVLLKKENCLLRALEFLILGLLTVCFKVKVMFDNILKIKKQDTIAPYYSEVIAGYCLGLMFFPVCTQWLIHLTKRYRKTDEWIGMIVFLSMCVSIVLSKKIILLSIKMALRFKEKYLSRDFSEEKRIVMEQFQETEFLTSGES